MNNVTQINTGSGDDHFDLAKLDASIGKLTKQALGLYKYVWPCLTEHVLKPYTKRSEDGEIGHNSFSAERERVLNEMYEKMDEDEVRFPRVIMYKLASLGIDAVTMANRFCVVMEERVPNDKEVERFLLEYQEEEEERRSALVKALDAGAMRSLALEFLDCTSKDPQKKYPEHTNKNFDRMNELAFQLRDLVIPSPDFRRKHMMEGPEAAAILHVISLYWREHCTEPGRDALSDAISQITELRHKEIKQTLNDRIEEILNL